MKVLLSFSNVEKPFNILIINDKLLDLFLFVVLVKIVSTFVLSQVTSYLNCVLLSNRQVLLYVIENTKDLEEGISSLIFHNLLIVSEKLSLFIAQMRSSRTTCVLTWNPSPVLFELMLTVF